MHAAELICPQAQSWSIAIFYANHFSLFISQFSVDGWIFLEVSRILRHDEVLIAIDKIIAIEILKLVAITQTELFRLSLNHRIQVEVGVGDVDNDEALWLEMRLVNLKGFLKQ